MTTATRTTRTVEARTPPPPELTLGMIAASWIEANLCHGPGDVQGAPLKLTDEQVRFLIYAYEITEQGRRVVQRAVYSRPKGTAKSELAAAVACFEGLGPCRFDHFDSHGMPHGQPIVAPFIPTLATEEGQAGHVFNAALFMLQHGRVNDRHVLDTGLTRINLPGGGKIEPQSARASSKDGGKETFAVADETHLYVSDELHRLHGTVRRNLSKRRAADGWIMDTTTAYAPGEGSVAEQAHEDAQKIASGEVEPRRSFYFDHRGAPASTVGPERQADELTDQELLDALRLAYGDAFGYMDSGRLIADLRDPSTVPEDWARYFLNIPQAARALTFIELDTWKALGDGDSLGEGRRTGLGMDGSRTGDTTVVAWASRANDGRIDVGCRVYSAARKAPAHVLHQGGTIDYDDVEGEIVAAFGRWDIVGGAYDPRYFERSTDILSKRLPREEQLQAVDPQSVKMREALGMLYGFAKEGVLRHEGDPVVAAHIRNVVGDFDADRGWTVRKRKQSGRIDAVIALALAIYALFKAPAKSKPYVRPPS